MRKLARVIALVLVAITSAIGLANLPREFRHPAATALQQSVQLGAALHAVLGVLVVIGTLRRRPWAVTVAISWAVTVVYTASVASVAWVSPLERDALLGAAAAGVSCALAGWWVVWAARSWGSGVER